MSDASKRQLLTSLAELLGFDDAGDACEDVLKHLLTIESQLDLLNYVTQFLGLDPTTPKNERVHKLCNDIAAFQRGESLFNQEGADDLNQQQQPPKQQQLPMDYGSSTASVVKRDLKEKKQQQQKSYKQKEKAPRRVLQKPTPPPNQQPTLLSVSNTRTEQPGSVDNVVVSATVEDKDETKQPFAAATNESSTTQLLVPESNDGTTLQPPRRGRRTNPVCDCFGTFHKALTNCLTCGRIACEPETYDYCPFCGYLLEPVQKPTSGGDAAQDLAWAHKERLLRYEREFALRTVVIDDHADYYSNPDKWHNDDELEDAAAKEQARHDKLHKRGAMELKLDL